MTHEDLADQILDMAEADKGLVRSKLIALIADWEDANALAGNYFGVTPEMIAAGGLELTAFDSSEGGHEDVAENVFRAMMAAHVRGGTPTPADARITINRDLRVYQQGRCERNLDLRADQQVSAVSHLAEVYERFTQK
jgi:uncharacterized Ntn-hydrolase superfamily protein